MIKYFVLLIYCTYSLQCLAEYLPNYCHDAETNMYWDDLKNRAVDNFEIVNLANVRDELCQKIDDGELTVEEATNLFEFERARVVDELRRR